jgi:hypothetical protein
LLYARCGDPRHHHRVSVTHANTHAADNAADIGIYIDPLIGDDADDDVHTGFGAWLFNGDDIHTILTAVII